MINLLRASLLLCSFNSFCYAHSFVQDESVKYRIDTLNKRSFELRSTHEALAINYAREAVALSKQNNYEEGLFSAYQNLGIQLKILGQYDSSIYYLKLSINYFKDPLKLGISKYYAGLIYSNLRDFDRAREYFSQAQETLQKAGDNPFTIYTISALGVVEARMGNYNRALDYFTDAYSIKKEKGLTADEELANIAHVYQIMGNFEKAKEFVLASLVISNNQKDSLGLVEGNINLGYIYQDLSQYDSAAYYLLKAYKISLQKGYSDQLATTLIAESELFIKMGRTDDAIAKLKNVFELPLHPKSAKRYIVNNKLANFFFEQGEYNKAIVYAKQSYNFFIHSSMYEEAQKSAILIATIFEKTRRLDSSNFFLRKALIHNDSVNVASNKVMFSDQRVRIETLEKDYEISQLLNQQKLNELERQRIKIWALVAVLGALIIIVVIVYQHKVVVKNNELIQLQLRSEIEQNKSDLYKQTLHMVQVNNSMEAIETEIREMLSANHDTKLAKILSSVKTNRSLKNEWNNFNKYFGNVHADFFEKLSKLPVELTTHEKRVCSLIKLNLSNREMATLLNIENRSVVMIKYRIKKKLSIPEETDIESYLQKL